MNKRTFYGLFILVLPCFIAGISYACNLPPQANIDGCPKYTAVDYETYFDGFSSDPDGYIVDWRWTFPPQAYDVNYHNPWEVTCKFSLPDVYCVSLEVEDNQGATDTFECTVYAIKMNISGDGAYITVNKDDDNENSIQDKDEFDEPVDDEDDLYQIALWIEPNLPDGRVKLQINVHEGTLHVWGEPNKATSLINPNHPNDPTTEHEWNVSGPFFKNVFVEGYKVHNTYPYGSLVVSYLHPTMGHSVDTDGAQFNPVEVCLNMSGVTEDTEEFPGNYILFNKDDDDNDGVPDYDDGFNKDGIPDNEDDDNPAEDDLVQIVLDDVQPNMYMEGTVEFNVFPPGTTKVKVWKADPCYPISGKLKDEQVSLPEEYETPNDLPKVFYVEGIEPSNGPGDVMFTLTYEELGFVDTVKVTVIHVELFVDANYTKPLDDWPKEEDHPRSPKYMFGKTDPIYVQVKNIGKDPDVVEDFNEAVVAISQSSGYIYTDLRETGADSQIFRNSIAERGELLYPSTEDKDDYPTTMDPDRITVMNEEVLFFYLSIPPGNTSNYKLSEHVMVDRAEIGVEYQERYVTYCKCKPEVPDLASHRFGRQLFDNIGGEPNLVWFKNFCEPDINSLLIHWHKYSDDSYVDSVDMTSWSGHCGSSWRSMHIFKEDYTCNNFILKNTELGNTDAEWIIFDMCYSLTTDVFNNYNDLKDDLVSSVSGQRCAHLFLGFHGLSFHTFDPNCGKYFAKRLSEVGIKQAWFDYCKNSQPPSTIVKIFGAEDCMDDSVAGPGPAIVSRDPTKDSVWKGDYYQKPPQ